MNRIDKKFKELKEQGKKALITYISAGDPTIEKSEKFIYALEEGGADIIELGIPFSDPLADGPVIQEAGLRSIGGGFNFGKLEELVGNIRKNSQIPLVVMVYYSSIICYGTKEFVDLMVKIDVDGVIIPDLPYEEYDEVKPYIDKTDLCMIPLVAVTSGDRVPMLVKEAKGFVYCVSTLGVTGGQSNFDKRIDDFLAEVKKYSPVPVCIGFGISKKADCDRFNKIGDGCIVGSAVIREINKSGGDEKAVKAFAESLVK
ncbi:MAG: tryptophan synthase subunit alpha [Clostridiales bacterium]|nr:tryptophan synthase subunit alpha [Clostridiales bacterium]